MVEARRVLLDALDALADHRDSQVLVGAQAVMTRSSPSTSSCLKPSPGPDAAALASPAMASRPREEPTGSRRCLTLEAGVDLRVVSGRLGHASVAITGDVYAQLIDRMDQQAADQVAALVFGPR
jgi:hypothetical protein